MMGINKGSHPEAFNKIMQIKQTQGEAAAKMFADKFYRENYWDKYNIGELPENTQTIVMDGVINHWSGFQKQLVDAAKNGASPEQLIDMRRKEYDRLANEPGKNGDYPWRASADAWENRMDNLESGLFGKTGTAFDDLDMSDKIRASKQVQDWAIKQEKLKFEDFAEWAKNQGMGEDEMIAAQAGRPQPQIIPKEQAKRLVETVKQFQNPDDFINFANQFSANFKNKTLAIKNLEQNGLGAEMNAAMSMAVKSPNEYRTQIESVLSWKNNTEVAKQNLADRQIKQSDIDIAVSKVWDDSDQFKAIEKKYGAKEAGNMKLAMQAIAKGYLAFNPNADSSTAAEFAVAPFLEEYDIGKIRGNIFNAPKGSNADVIADRLETYYQEKLVPVYGENFKFDDISPVLNNEEDGFYFVDPLYNTVMLPGGGHALTVKFSELLGYAKTESRAASRSRSGIVNMEGAQ
jgi:hypothetical protein